MDHSSCLSIKDIQRDTIDPLGNFECGFDPELSRVMNAVNVELWSNISGSSEDLLVTSKTKRSDVRRPDWLLQTP